MSEQSKVKKIPWSTLIPITALAVFVLSLNLIKKFRTASQDSQFIMINGQKIFVEIADTPEKIGQGLSNRESMPENQGMLFIFKQSAVRPFWMKEMKFDLDFVFIKDKKVIDLATDIPRPADNRLPTVIIAKADFDQALEVNSGTIKKLGIEIGQEVTFRK
ncbi:MAG: DUF192 domain-containing protein [Candidatus Pacebacteria bacterium]|nr:DUF192 domain-containing protein [Candidatus Paceibacterota bacterium]